MTSLIIVRHFRGRVKPYLLSMLGLALDIVGAFLLAAEAIKIRNLVALRTRYLQRAHTAALSPKLVYTGSNVHYNVTKRYLRVFNALHYLAGFAVLYLLDAMFQGQLLQWLSQATHWLLAKQWYWIALGTVIAVIYGGYFGVWAVGECVHVTLTWSLKSCIKCLEFIEHRTPDGTVGILGFILLFLGFALQMIGTYLGGASV